MMIPLENRQVSSLYIHYNGGEVKVWKKVSEDSGIAILPSPGGKWCR